MIEAQQKDECVEKSKRKRREQRQRQGGFETVQINPHGELGRYSEYHVDAGTAGAGHYDRTSRRFPSCFVRLALPAWEETLGGRANRLLHTAQGSTCWRRNQRHAASNCSLQLEAYMYQSTSPSTCASCPASMRAELGSIKHAMLGLNPVSHIHHGSSSYESACISTLGSCALPWAFLALYRVQLPNALPR